MKRTFQFIAAVVFVSLAGCFTPSPIARVIAENKLSPVVDAIEAFKREAGRVPDNLEELQAKQVRKLVISYSTDSGFVWIIAYEKKSATSYQVSFNHVHYSLFYADGKQVDWMFHPWQ